jgi:7-cyano-7-deazaguanine reductase
MPLPRRLALRTFLAVYAPPVQQYNHFMAKKTPAIETFANPHPKRDYLIKHVAPEFTSVCPKTGQPDFGTIEVEYVADKLCIELKAFKFYLQGFRNKGIFYEDVVNVILDDLTALCRPRWMKVTGSFTPRGGIHSIVCAEYAKPGPKRRRAS